MQMAKWLRILLVLIAAVGLWACGRTGPARGEDSRGSAVRVQLQGVSARQYLGAAMRFSFEAQRVELDEVAGELAAKGGVRAELEPVLWTGRKP